MKLCLDKVWKFDLSHAFLTYLHVVSKVEETKNFNGRKRD